MNIPIETLQPALLDPDSLSQDNHWRAFCL